jgi:hypothetical protein
MVQHLDDFLVDSHLELVEEDMPHPWIMEEFKIKIQ